MKTWHRQNWRTLLEIIGAIIAAVSGYLVGQYYIFNLCQKRLVVKDPPAIFYLVASISFCMIVFILNSQRPISRPNRLLCVCLQFFLAISTRSKYLIISSRLLLISCVVIVVWFSFVREDTYLVSFTVGCVSNLQYSVVTFLCHSAQCVTDNL